jgi:hypothetical protein
LDAVRLAARAAVARVTTAVLELSVRAQAGDLAAAAQLEAMAALLESR